MKKTVNSAESINAYKRLADDKADGGDLLGALGLYFTAHRYDPRDLGAIEGIADCYADMGLLELSNKYWFLFLSYAPKDKESVAFEGSDRAGVRVLPRGARVRGGGRGCDLGAHGAEVVSRE